MKETINVNIGSRAFTLDKDAHTRLAAYFDDVLNRLGGDTETMNDIECRFAEIFSESLSSPMMVVSLHMVDMAIARMGDPDAFGPSRGRRADEPFEPFGEERSAAGRKLRRSRSDRSIAGVCGGVAEYFGIESAIVRLTTLALVIFGGLSLWVYIIAWIAIPEQEREDFMSDRRGM